MDELRQSLVLTMELEDTKLKAQNDLKMRDAQISHLKELLTLAIKERDEAQQKCQKVLYEKLILQHQLQQQQNSGNISSTDQDDPTRVLDSNNGFSSSDCDESIVSSPHHLPPPPPASELPIVVDRPLPEKGKLLGAVMKAGPLLQTLLLAGPLPQWRHPPPPLDTYQIPPPPLVIPSPPPNNNVNKCGNLDRKRGLSEGSDSSMEMKYQRIVLQ
ncbi:hypothetical protein BUALT_Bualt13G0069300 [Buddleja alternifolia]|uniref:Uncharacterized protein n=1 Tax=Buddleja alternifolia TaxID=168488 RepID=A0AAV6WS44_9LAMI|nr:hypothetical protein BUALT_Bualt13G0069300 [Buddleja alternifolia]